MPRTFFISGNWTTAAKIGDRRRIVPIPQIADQYAAFEQDYTIARASFAPVAMNTVSPDVAAAYLQRESDGIDLGNEMMRWTRGYYPIPPSWNEWEKISYTFPEYPGYPTGTPLGRSHYSPPEGVTCRVHRDYFMVGAGQTYANEGLIPLIPVQTFTGLANPTFYWDPPTVVPAGGITIGSNAWLESVPNRTLWNTWVSNASGTGATKGWGSGYDDGSGKWQSAGQVGVTNPGQIVVSCNLERLVGNIWARVTRYVLAQ